MIKGAIRDSFLGLLLVFLLILSSCDSKDNSPTSPSSSYFTPTTGMGPIQTLLLGRWEGVDTFGWEIVSGMEYRNNGVVIWYNPKGDSVGSEKYIVDENAKRIYYPQSPLYPNYYVQVVSISSTTLVGREQGLGYWPEFPTVTFKRIS